MWWMVALSLAQASEPEGFEISMAAEDAEWVPVDWSAITLKKSRPPAYPSAARRMDLEERCTARFYVNKRGKPRRVEVEGCHPVFFQPVRQATRGWRFEPYVDGAGNKQKVTFTVTINFQLTDSEVTEP